MHAAEHGRVDEMRFPLNHPSADAASLMVDSNHRGCNALSLATVHGNVGAMLLLLDHPSAANTAALMEGCAPDDESALVLAASFATGRPNDFGNRPSCAPLLLLLRRVPAEASQPCDAHQAHMTKVMEAFRQGEEEFEDQDEWEERVNRFSNDDNLNDARDKCVRLLHAHGARGYDPDSPVMRRIVRELAQLACVTHLLNNAVVGVAMAARGQHKPRHGAARRPVRRAYVCCSSHPGVRRQALTLAQTDSP
ncbi:hypothetical protein FOA52_007998 [Chlamydomonas sp. UWO 241]|nr:hypothetical protein FOA52_007998 [Chlamydomonas sp. UWO 241]